MLQIASKLLRKQAVDPHSPRHHASARREIFDRSDYTSTLAVLFIAAFSGTPNISESSAKLEIHIVCAISFL
jgi:hypothetical protein